MKSSGRPNRSPGATAAMGAQKDQLVYQSQSQRRPDVDDEEDGGFVIRYTLRVGPAVCL